MSQHAATETTQQPLSTAAALEEEKNPEEHHNGEVSRDRFRQEATSLTGVTAILTTKKRKATSCFNIEDDDDFDNDSDGGVDTTTALPLLEPQQQRPSKRGGGRTPDNTLWMEMYEDLCEFRKLHGHCRVPPRRSYKVNPGLAQWVCTQRENYHRYQTEQADTRHKNHAVGRQRIELLNRINFVWKLEPRTIPWETKFQELLEYKRLQGHCDVPTKHETLGRWVDTQRYHYKLYKENRPNRMTPEKIQQLNSIGGWNWKLKDQQKWNWNELYNKLVDYHQTHGHSMVPKLYALDRRLGLFVQKQRSAYKAGTLPQPKIELLERIDFQWVVRDRSGGGKGVGAMKRSVASMQRQQQQQQREHQQREQELRAALAQAEQEAQTASEELRVAAAVAKKKALKVQQLQAQIQRERVDALQRQQQQRGPQQQLLPIHAQDGREVGAMIQPNNAQDLDSPAAGHTHNEEHGEDENAIEQGRINHSELENDEQEDLYADYRQVDLGQNGGEAKDRPVGRSLSNLAQQQHPELQQQHQQQQQQLHQQQQQLHQQLLLGQQQQMQQPTSVPDELGPYGCHYPHY